MRAFLRRHAIPIVLLLGLAARIPLMSMPSNGDMESFRMWGAQALRHGIVNVYSLTDSDILYRLMLKWRGIPYHRRIASPTDLGVFREIPDYPPGNILTLEFSVALCKYLQGGFLQAGPFLNACINFPPLLFSLGIVLATWLFTRRERGAYPLEAVASFWLNPAIILTSPILGLQDPIFAFFALLSLFLFYRRNHTLSVLSLALGCLTKPQGVFVVPVVVVALFAEGGWRMFRRYVLQFALFLLLPLLPYVFASRLLGMIGGVFTQVIGLPLSTQQLNVWWLVGAATNALTARSWKIFGNEAPMVSHAQFISVFGFDPLWIALPAFLLFTGLNLYFLYQQLRSGNRWSVFWAAALEVFGYNMVMIYTHEHHLFAFFVYSLPLMAIGSKLFKRLFWWLSVTYALNLFLFEGLGQGFEDTAHWLRTLPGFDWTMVVAMVNVAIFFILIKARHWWFDQVVMEADSSKQPN